MPLAKSQTPLFTPVLMAGCLIIMVSFAVRASFGVFQIPIAEEFGWPRAEFSLAIAIQNLAWGIGQPIFGAIAEKIGDRKAIILGALIYAAGLVLSACADHAAGAPALCVARGLRHRGHGLRRDPGRGGPRVLGREPVDVAGHRHRGGIGRAGLRRAGRGMAADA